MLDRAACERRVYRLATLLTGNPSAATRVIAAVIGAQPDLSHLDSAHMDRLTVLRSREVPSRKLPPPAGPAEFRGAIAELSPQQREAWIFRHVYGLTVRECARSMDCSATATGRHLETAEVVLRGRLGDQVDDAPAILRAYSLQLDVPPIYRARMRRRTVMRRALWIALAAAVAIGAVFGATWWLQNQPLPGRGDDAPASVAEDDKVMTPPRRETEPMEGR